MTNLLLRRLRPDDQEAFEAAINEFASVLPTWEFAIGYAAAPDFATYLAKLEREQRGDVPSGWVPHSFLVAVVGNTIVGRLSLRHTLNDFLESYGGHIGFGVVPSHQCRGYGTQMLQNALPLARDQGLDRVLLTCDDDNVASMTVIERCGGVLQDRHVHEDGELIRRYWISLK